MGLIFNSSTFNSGSGRGALAGFDFAERATGCSRKIQEARVNARSARMRWKQGGGVSVAGMVPSMEIYRLRFSRRQERPISAVG